MEPEELTPGRRIQRLDTPQKGNSPQRGGHDNHVSSRPPRTRFWQNRSGSSPERRKSSSADHDHDRGLTSDSENDDGDATQPLRKPSFNRAKQQTSSTTDSTIILRPKPTSSSSQPSSPTRQKSPTDMSPVRTQFLLEPAHAQQEDHHRRGVTRHLHNVLGVLNRPVTSASLRLVILGLKLLSTLQPCLSSGINAVVVYPLICLALLEFSVTDLRVWKAALASLVHFGVLAVAWRTHRLCRNPNELFASWED